MQNSFTKLMSDIRALSSKTANKDANAWRNNDGPDDTSSVFNFGYKMLKKKKTEE